MTDLMTLPAFADPDVFHVVVESPRGSMLKLKYDPHHEVITLSRPLTTGLSYPYDWGFVPSTRGPDGDPIDVIVMWDSVSYPGIVLPCRPIGMLRVEQTDPTSHARERNDRVAALPIKAPRWEFIHTVFDFSERVRQELEHFFRSAVAFEGRELKLLGWTGPEEAIGLVRSSQKDASVNHR